jgi:hypothetical protein
MPKTYQNQTEFCQALMAQDLSMILVEEEHVTDETIFAM